MPPNPSIHNAADSAIIEPKSISYLLKIFGRIEGSYLKHLRLGEFGRRNATSKSMSLLSLLVGHVLLVRSKEQVKRINAGPIVATVENMQRPRIKSPEKLPRNSVCGRWLAAPPEMSIPILDLTRSPLPTRVRVWFNMLNELA